MSHNLELDNEYVRQQFPAFEDRLSKKLMFFENAGGSYVPQTVVNKLNEFMIKTKVQPYGDFELSKIAGEQMDEGIRVFAEMINADFNEVIIGNSTQKQVIKHPPGFKTRSTSAKAFSGSAQNINP